MGQAGELLVHGPQVFAGHWDQPKETAEAHNRLGKVLRRVPRDEATAAVPGG